MKSTHIGNEGTHGILEVFGPTVEFLIVPEEAEGAYCVMTGTIPPDVSVPLHSHPDIESFFLVSGAVQVMSQRDGKFEWFEVSPASLFTFRATQNTHGETRRASQLCS
jgi:hypothetical protein